jgi:exodeoxyribonuclease VII small subunit
MATKTAAKGSFESALQRLEAIVEEMQSSELSLEARLKRFEEGVALVRECAKALEAAAKKVEVLVKSSGGKLETRLFDEVRQRLRETESGDYAVEEDGSR